MTPSRRFPISFDRWYGVFSSLLGLPPSTAYVEFDGAQVEVRMGWASDRASRDRRWSPRPRSTPDHSAGVRTASVDAGS